MYSQIELQEEDRCFHRFLWQSENKIQKFEFNRVAFDINASPFRAQFVAQYNARQFGKDMQRSQETIYGPIWTIV